jgi:transcriptional regulator with XRE-family HTH domain
MTAATTRTMAELIRMHRKAQGLSQRELGALFVPPIGQTTVAAWETGQNRPSIEQLPALAKHLKVSLDALLEPFQP